MCRRAVESSSKVEGSTQTKRADALTSMKRTDKESRCTDLHAGGRVESGTCQRALGRGAGPSGARGLKTPGVHAASIHSLSRCMAASSYLCLVCCISWSHLFPNPDAVIAFRCQGHNSTARAHVLPTMVPCCLGSPNTTSPYPKAAHVTGLVRCSFSPLTSAWEPMRMGSFSQEDWRCDLEEQLLAMRLRL